MIHRLDDVLLRPLERGDLDALYQQKNDPQVVSLLGGFSHGYARDALEHWLESHRGRQDEVLWAICESASDRCLGHVGFYQVDHRIRSAEFAIMLGDRDAWGRGIGTRVTRFVVDYGFGQMNLNRVHLTVLSTNPRATHIYEELGFKHEGRLRQAQFKDGEYVDVVVMGLLRADWQDSSSNA